MPGFEHVRHRSPLELERPRELVLACAPLNSNINLSRILRAAGCCGVRRVVCCGTAKVVRKIARDGADSVELEIHRTLPPVLRALRDDGCQLVALEQTTGSIPLTEFSFARKTALVIGNERAGLSDDVLSLVDRVVEIPIWGLPHAHNAATAAAIAMYEYCRQFPRG
jgi:tRNA G18 (ribose-2'-O)-methylase SpoU